MPDQNAALSNLPPVTRRLSMTLQVEVEATGDQLVSPKVVDAIRDCVGQAVEAQSVGAQNVGRTDSAWGEGVRAQVQLKAFTQRYFDTNGAEVAMDDVP